MNGYNLLVGLLLVTIATSLIAQSVLHWVNRRLARRFAKFASRTDATKPSGGCHHGGFICMACDRGAPPVMQDESREQYCARLAEMGADADLLVPNDSSKWGPICCVCSHVHGGAQVAYVVRPYPSVWYLACGQLGCTGKDVRLDFSSRIPSLSAEIIMRENDIFLVVNATPPKSASRYSQEHSDWLLAYAPASDLCDASQWYLPAASGKA